MAEAGSVGWQFSRASYFAFSLGKHDQDAIFELAVEAGANDVTFDDNDVEIFGPVEAFKAIGDRLRASGIHPEEAELRMIPNQEIELSISETLAVMKTIEALEDLDDVQNVYTNLKMTEEALAALESD